MWPEGEAFGGPGAEPEEEFMTLREVLFADLGVEEQEQEGGQEEQEDDAEIEEEEEDDQEQKMVSVEQQFDFKAFVFRFAIQRVVTPFGTLFSSYSKNSKDTNYQIIKMFHR